MIEIIMIAIEIILSSVQTGWASQYQSTYIMDATVAVRQEWGQLPEDLSYWDGFVAMESCENIGKTAWIRIVSISPLSKSSDKSDYRWQWHPYLVSDCSGHESTTKWMLENNILVEFGRREAERLGITNGEGARGGIKIELVLVNKGEHNGTISGGG